MFTTFIKRLVELMFLGETKNLRQEECKGVRLMNQPYIRTLHKSEEELQISISYSSLEGMEALMRSSTNILYCYLNSLEVFDLNYMLKFLSRFRKPFHD